MSASDKNHLSVRRFRKLGRKEEEKTFRFCFHFPFFPLERQKAVIIESDVVVQLLITHIVNLISRAIRTSASMAGGWCVRVALALALLGSVRGLSKQELFPYGPQAGDQQLPPNNEDVSSKEISLDTHIKFFGREYGSIYVSYLNGTTYID